MTSPWLTDAQLAGPYGTQRIPQVEDLLPALKAQLHNAPQVQLKGYPVERWRLSPFVWGMQNMADNLEAAAKTRADRESLDVAISEMARRFDVSVTRLRRTIDRSRNIMEVSLDDDDPPDPPRQGPRGPQGPPGPGVDPSSLASALAPMFQDLGTVIQVGNSNLLGELQMMRREGQNPDEDMQYHGSSSKPDPPKGGGRVLRVKQNRNVTFKRVEVNNTYYPQQMNATPPEQKPNTGAADDIDMVNPPGGRGPPPDPDANAREFAEMGRGFLDQLRQFAAQTARAHQA